MTDLPPPARCLGPRSEPPLSCSVGMLSSARGMVHHSPPPPPSSLPVRSSAPACQPSQCQGSRSASQITAPIMDDSVWEKLNNVFTKWVRGSSRTTSAGLPNIWLPLSRLGPLSDDSSMDVKKLKLKCSVTDMARPVKYKTSTILPRRIVRLHWYLQVL